MAKNRKKNSSQERWLSIDECMREYAPHLSAWWNDDEEFSELRLKARPDGTTLAIAKGYGGDGGPVVCFGVGYGVPAALLAIDGTINGGRWKVDEPWQPGKG